MPPIKLPFYGKGIHNPITGYLLLRYMEEAKVWKLRSWQSKNDKRENLQGYDPIDGAQLLIFLVNSFLIEWESVTQKNIDEMRYVLSRYGQNQKLEKRGFRPITAQQAWFGYRKESEEEISKTKEEITKVEEKLSKWIPHNGFNFPSFKFDLPWRKIDKLL
jgi:hypothetical protein